jgi:sugar lactone lactonase YvrE
MLETPVLSLPARSRASWGRAAPFASVAACVVIALSLAACSSDQTPVASAVETLKPELIPFSEGEPASAFWAEGSQQLYIADNQNNQLWRWSDQGGLVKHATTLDPGGEVEAGGTLVGQIIALDDGTLLVARFGKPGGGFAGIAYVRSDGSSGLVPGVDENSKHLGLTQAADGSIYSTFFARPPGGTGQAGSVARVDLAKGETVVADGFGKLVGLVAIADTLYVSDQSAGVIYSAPLAALPAHATEWTAFAQLPVPDLVCAGPDGSLFSGQFQAPAGASEPPAVRQVHSDGSVTRFVSDPDVAKPSGVAYDPSQRRLFAVDTGDVARIGVHIFPVP